MSFSFGSNHNHSLVWMPACRNRKVTMSELVEPVVTLEFYEISRRGKKLPAEAAEFSAFLKMHIARWAGEAGVL
jgi:LysR family transcriptional regulator, carnitine catabolism transcriptional activator